MSARPARGAIGVAGLIDALRDALLVIDGRNGRLLDVNAAACAISGYSRADLPTMSAADLRVPEQRESFPQTLRESIERDELAPPYRVDWLTRDGRRLPLEFSNRRIDTANGPVIVAAGREMAERLALEESAREAAERFALILDNAPLSIQLKDVQGRFTQVNDAYARLLGRPREELIGRSVRDFYPAELANLYDERDRQVFESGESTTFESTQSLTDTKQYFLTVKFPLVNSRAETTGVGTIISDITALRQAQQQLDEFFTLSNDIFVVFNDGVFERFNPALERVLGYSAEELQGKPAAELIHPDDLAAVTASSAFFTQANHSYHIEVRYRHKLGHYIWLDWTGSPRTDDGRSFFAARDVTERRRMQNEAEAHALQQATLSNLSRLALDDIEIEALLEESAQLVREALGTEVAAILEAVSGEQFAVRAVVGAEAELRAAQIGHTSIAGYALQRGATVMSRDLRGETRFELSDLQKDLKLVAGMAAPLRLREGVYGVIEVFTRQRRAFTLEEATFLASVASVLATAIDRARAAQALRDSEERYRRIFEDAAEGVFQSDGSGRFVVANSAVARILGYRSGAELVAAVSDIRTQIAVDPTRVDDLELLVRTTGAAQAFTMQVRRRDGSIADVRLNARAATAADGRPAISALVSDVTVEHAAARALRESEERYRRIFEDSAEGIYQTDGGARFAFMNPACARILGYDSPAEAIAGIDDIGHTYVDPTRRAQIVALIQRQGSVQGEEFALRRRDGSIATVSLNARLVDDGRGGTAIAGVCNDITAQREARNALQRSEEQYRRIVESTSEGIWTIDADSRTTFVNGRLADMLGYTREEMLGRPVRDFVAPDSVMSAEAALARRATGIAESHTEQLVHKNGATVYVESSATPLTEDGRYAGSLALVRDMSELREARQYKHRAFHDALTGLPNRALFSEYLEQGLRTATRRGAPLAVLMIDLDGFKAVNDTLGHQAGDVVLQTVATRLRGALRESDAVARLGGDEFAVLLPDTDPLQATLVAEKLIAAVREPVAIGRETAAVGLSVGAAAFPKHGHSAALLIRRADSAMYAAKRARLGFAMWSATLEQRRARAS